MRRITRRRLLTSGAAALAFQAGLGRSRSQTAWPSKPVRILVGFPVGGGTDLIARTYAQFLSKRFGQPFVVENKPGAVGSLAAIEAKRSAADGYTLLCTISTTLIQNRITMKELGYDPDRDFVLLTQLVGPGLVVIVSPKSGARNLADFVAFVRKAGSGNFGTYSIGSFPHIVSAELSKQYDVAIEPIHYRGEVPMWADLANHSLDAAAGGYNGALPVLQTGRGDPIGIIGNKRLPSLPDIPTLSEQGATSKIFEARGFTAFAAPTGTADAVLAALSDAILAAGRDDIVGRALAPLSLEQPVSADAARKRYAAEAPLILEVLRSLNIQPE